MARRSRGCVAVGAVVEPWSPFDRLKANGCWGWRVGRGVCVAVGAVAAFRQAQGERMATRARLRRGLCYVWRRGRAALSLRHAQGERTAAEVWALSERRRMGGASPVPAVCYGRCPHAHSHGVAALGSGIRSQTGCRAHRTGHESYHRIRYTASCKHEELRGWQRRTARR